MVTIAPAVATPAAASTGFVQQRKKLTPGTASEGLFGNSMALSADGNTALIGAPCDGARQFGPECGPGAAWVFIRSRSKWTQQGTKLTGGGAVGGPGFGDGVALSADGNTALIGGAIDNNGVGAAWVFTRSGSTWSQQGEKLTAADEEGQGNFATSVALSADGNTALIGGPGDNAVWVFTRSGSTWSHQGSKIVVPEQLPGSYLLGDSVALSSDGNTALVGNPGELAPGPPEYTLNRPGAAWVFTRSGGTWTQQGGRLQDTSVGHGDFGDSVALSSDGNTALVGGHCAYGQGRADEYRCGPGAVAVFARSGSTWSEQGAPFTTTEASGGFGRSVALSANGNTALIGGHYANRYGRSVGTAWVFTRSGGTWTQQESKLNAHGRKRPGFGEMTVALSADSRTAIAADPGDNNFLGAAWVFVQ